ncbi:DMT family protein [Phenylobacterium sp.]|uniref:DMT family protein n=1 Tax=Phenylobacterium sp. TaxID=1871053 RepID=UPI002F41EB03
MPTTVAAVAPILMLIASNVFMTFAWYGQLKVEHRPLWLIVLISWGIAFFEYCLAVPANRIGRHAYDPASLKALQEVITLAVFAVFSVTWLGERFTLNHAVGFILIAAGAAVVFKGPF